MSHWERIAQLIAEGRVHIPSDAEIRRHWEGTFTPSFTEYCEGDVKRTPFRPNLRPGQVVVGIFCCACRKQYPPREAGDLEMYDYCQCGHLMGKPGWLCENCGVVTEFRGRQKW